MKYVYKDGIIDLTKKLGAPNAKVKTDLFYEASIDFRGHNLVWLDVFVNEADEGISLSLAVKNNKTNLTKVMIGEQAVPNGAFISLFNHKLISDKTIIIRSNKPAVVSFESREEIQD